MPPSSPLPIAASRRTLLAYRVLVFAAILVLMGDSSLAWAEDAVTVGVAGSEEILWVFQRRPEPDGTLLLRFAYWSADARPPIHFAPLGMTPVRGGIRHAVVLDRYLHIIYRDGTHKRYRPSSYVSDPWSSAVQTDERILPHSAVPQALASDEEGAALVALLLSREAAELTTPPEGNEMLPPDEPTVVMTRPLISVEQTVIARFSKGRWMLDRPGPPGVTSATSTSVLLARSGELHLIYRGENGDLLHTSSPRSEDAWTAPAALPLDQPPVQLAGDWEQNAPVLIYAERMQSDMRVSALFLEEHRWTQGPILRNEDGTEMRFVHPLGFDLFRSQIAVASLNDDGNVQVGLWLARSGEIIEAPSVVNPLVRRKPAGGDGLNTLLIQYAVLASLLIGIFIWRRDNLLVLIPITPDRQLTPLIKRLAAVLIDLTVLFPVWGPLMFMLIVAEGSDSLHSFMLPTLDSTTPAAIWFRPILGAVFGLYGAVLEGLFGATLGKRINGLSVVDHRGKRPRFAAILIRNAARILEFNYPPLCLLVVMTPARQRVGDILAQTVVLSNERRGVDRRDQQGGANP